jgi:hypothetical protein
MSSNTFWDVTLEVHRRFKDNYCFHLQDEVLSLLILVACLASNLKIGVIGLSETSMTYQNARSHILEGDRSQTEVWL